MKISKYIIIFLGVFYISSNATSIRSQVSLLEASENIRLHSQEIVKNYLYYYINPEKKVQKELLLSGLLQLDEQFRIIAKATKDDESKDILTFLDYSKEKMEEVLQDPFNKDNPALMLDYSEVLLEGADMISINLNYSPSMEEKMLIKMKDISFLLERMTKYYLAILIEEDNSIYKEMLDEAMMNMEENLLYISDYKYNEESLIKLQALKQDWQVLRSFLKSAKEMKLPNIISLASLEVRRDALALENFHSKNQ
jgi:hypothetical protein